MANKLNVIFELHRQGKRICESAPLLQVHYPTISNESKGSKSLAMKETNKEGAEKELWTSPETDNWQKKRVSRNLQVSKRKKKAKQTGISQNSVRVMSKEELNLYPYMLKQTQFLTDKTNILNIVTLGTCVPWNIQVTAQSSCNFMLGAHLVLWRKAIFGTSIVQSSKWSHLVYNLIRQIFHDSTSSKSYICHGVSKNLRKNSSGKNSSFLSILELNRIKMCTEERFL